MKYVIVFFLLFFHFNSCLLWCNEESISNEEFIWSKEENLHKSLFDNHQNVVVASWKDYIKKVKLKWADGSVSEQKVYVEYYSNEDERLKIDFENEKMVVEVLSEEKNDSVLIKNKIESIVNNFLSSPKNSSLISSDEINKKAIDFKNITISKSLGSDGKSRVVHGIEIGLVPEFVIRRAKKIKSTVDVWANKYQLDSSYILAIIRQESAFNPMARSWVPALGLMQIVPKYAGLEVMKVVTGKAIKPDEVFLYNPEKNIMIGTTYLHLLRDKYFPKIKDREKQIILMTASYNWGPHRIQKAINSKKIPENSDSKETYEIIQRIAPTETKNYVQKVLKFYAEFKELGF
jgi:membrane-bound lytic murein transglycosylase C